MKSNAERQKAWRERRKHEEEFKRKNYARTKKHKAKKYLEKRKQNLLKPTKSPWQPHFIGVDGESFLTGRIIKRREGRRVKKIPEQAYCLLKRADLAYPLYKPEGLSTRECLDYLTKWSPAKAHKPAFVGFFLTFDFEWVLKDLTEEEYMSLREGLEVYFEHVYKLKWIAGKRLEIYKLKRTSLGKTEDEVDAKDYFCAATIQDTQGFFQSSFLSALAKFGLSDLPEYQTIVEGKAERGDFLHRDWEKWARYNDAELTALDRLMHALYDSFESAYTKIQLSFRVHSGSWSGPGWFANDFLKQTFWKEEHPYVAEDIVDAYYALPQFSEQMPKRGDNNFPHPFALAYYGGRIELSGIGKFEGTTYNYDINSAYPYAMSLLPKWEASDFRAVEIYVDEQPGYTTPYMMRQDFDTQRPMGMVNVVFNFPHDWTWYPFPVRVDNNVYYPRRGRTWIMTPEYYALKDALTEEEFAKYVQPLNALVLMDSEGYGDALHRIDSDNLSTTSLKILEMARIRLQEKKAGGVSEKALKLILNSLYGKTVQQVGSHKNFQDFAASWITSTCRALLWRALTPEIKTHNVIMCMTDGIYSRVPLAFPEDRLSDVLGEWDAETFTYFETFKPGIYRYEKKGKMNYKVRGYLTPTEEEKERLFSLAWEAMTTGHSSKFPSRNFLPRVLTREGWQLEAFRYQFYESDKDVKSELSAKRQGAPFIIPEGKTFAFFPPKVMGPGHNLMNDSEYYRLKFKETLDPDEELSEEEMLKYLARVDALQNIEEYTE